MSFRSGSWVIAIVCAIVLDASCSPIERNLGGTAGAGGSATAGEAGANDGENAGNAGGSGGYVGVGGDSSPGTGDGSTCMGGCGPESMLSVLSIAPQDGARDVARDAPVVITFSEPVTAASLPASISITVSGVAIAGAFTISGASATFKPTLPLPTAADLTLSIATGVRAQAGGTLSTAATATFSTVDGAWGTPSMVAGAPGGDVVSIKAFPLANGGALAVWARMQSSTAIAGLWSSNYSAGTGWTAAKQIDGKDGAITSYNSAAFALDHDGNAAVGWEQNKQVRIAHCKAGAGWQAPINLGTDTLGDAAFGGLSFDSAGNAFATWTQTSASYVDVWGARYDSRKGWSGQAILDTSNVKGESPSLAVSSNGRALIVWKQGSQAWSDYYTTDWQGAQQVQIDGGSGTVLSGGSVAFISTTDALAIWRVYTGTGAPQVWNALYSETSGWQAAAANSVPTPSTLDVNALLLAGHETGSALALFSDDSESLEWGGAYVKSNGWKTAGQVSSGVVAVDYASAVVDVGGNGIGAWTEATSHVVARRYLAGLGWSSAHPFTPSSSAATQYPALGSDDSGTTWIAWAYQGQGWAAAFQ